jgi:preprotein translocase subunit SecG
MSLLITFLYILFVLAAIVLIVVILLQEGKGGGLGQALGGHGQATFGVGAKGINTFTAWTAVVFLGSALVIHVLHRMEQGDLGVEMPGQQIEPADRTGGAGTGTTPVPSDG